MATYCISDIHGCYDEFMALLNKIKFNPEHDAVYILGDVIDRGSRPIDCVQFIQKTKCIYFLMGNHEQMLLDFIDCKNNTWYHNGYEATMAQLELLPEGEVDKLVDYIRRRPYYKTVKVGEKRFFLSHAGLNPRIPFYDQSDRALLWSRKEFFGRKARNTHVCIFGHTPTTYLTANGDFSVWFDPIHDDKICIDCGCVFGGRLAALRLDDMEPFYVEAL
ncbi:MAG: metallophosphoesterase [Oscillospiraceae bacterium]|nr:metallophosphoesterase [Oscillospiraceae bacterium]